ncbi:polypeptide N-acetylgalactosaminyltransferase 8 [Drosophila biarmipes]|uniref:polypeptide N-acetylgalactosaminyltransferase 8 n=1 Tax=Drosophila biarmipes TaxID=125945 RepID=UPI0007E5E5DD|nr:polypeptide N-acetylgalactosaminyltransferase 8 [Drosophila biarmipes]
MCLDLLRHKKKVLLLLLMMATGSTLYYLYTLQLERERDAKTSSTTSRLEREISELQAVFESEVIPDLGALGRPARGNWTQEEVEAMATSQRERGYNAWLSKRISPERTLYDMRHRSCKKLEYSLEKLPSVSVVITYHNEEASVLLRTLSSLRSRTPILLLREIVLVDDGSSAVDEKLNDFLQIKFLNMVRHHRLPSQVGLMQARVAGAQLALADVLVFLDSHVEVTKGWLEPLLAPILRNNRTCTTPIIDTIDYDNFSYRRGKPSRGFFNWQFNYIQLPLLKEEAVALPAPHKNPIMNGGLFAIGRQWFAELGGYDKGLKIWGAEQFELSLKLWLCGGQILEVPCSRVGHLYRDGRFQIRYTDKNKDKENKIIARNYRRVAEVWLDEFKDKIFANMPHLTVLSVGSLTEQRELKKRLHCKPFKWFLNNLAADFLNLYPIIDPAEYASGVLQSVASPKLCLDRNDSRHEHPKLSPCSSDHVFPISEQHWILSNRRELKSGYYCLEVRNQGKDLRIYQCHGQSGNQFWSYDPKSRQVIAGQMANFRQCLEAHPKTSAVTSSVCDPKKSSQQWKFGYQNNQRLSHFWDNVKTK